MSVPADPNAPTRTAAPAGSDVDRTHSSGDQTQDASAISLAPRLPGGDPTVPGHVSPLRPRLPAPLQYRDPERYELQAEHGRGGLGRVMRARDRELGRSIAIKELLRPTATSELRFFREALITARLEHPSIVPVHEAGRWPDGTPFYAMKLVAGRPLREAIDDAGSLPKRLALIPHVIAVADAIAYAHSKRIIHRDLKPSNVLVGDFGETVVIDWGLAKDLDSAETSVDEPATPAERGSSLTIAGTILGTPGYMPPEQERGVADERSDVYALGGILFQVVFNQAPHSEVPETDPVAARVPAALVAIVRRAMAADPAQRYRSAGDFAQDLRDFQGGRLVGAHRYSFAELVGHWASHNKRLLALGVVAAVLLAVVLAVSARRIVAERTTAELERDRARSGAAELVLSHARNAVASDPTKALLWLARYQGPDLDTARDLVAEAIGRGVSRYVLNGQDQSVMRFAALDDGAFLSSSSEGTLREWRVQGSKVTSRELVGALDLVGSFDYHRARRRLVFATLAGDVVVRDPGLADRVVGHVADWLAVIELSADGGRLVVGTLAGEAYLIALDEPVAPVVLHPAGVESRVLAFVDDGQRIFFAGEDGAMIIYDGHTGARIASRSGPPAIEGTVGRGGRAVVVHADSTASLVDSGLAIAATVPIPTGCKRAAISPDGALLALGCSDRLAVLALPSGVLVHEQTHSVAPFYPQFSPDGRRLAVAVGDIVYLVSTADWSTLPLRGHRGTVYSQLAFLGDAVVSGDEHGEVRVWSLPRESRSSRAPGDLRNLAVSRDGALVASVSDLGVVRLWESDGKLRREHHDGDGVIAMASFTADGAHVIAPGFDGKARIWPTTGAAAPVVLDAGGGELLHALPMGADVVTLGSDGRLLRWDVASRTSTLVHRDPKRLLYAEVRGDRMIFGGDAGVVYEYDGTTGRVVEIARHGGPLVGIRASSDGHRVISVAADRVARLTPRAPGAPSHEVVLPAKPINAHLSPDGRVLAVAAEDRMVRVFDVRDDGFHLRAVHEADVRRMRFAPTGQVLAAACIDGIVRVWDLAGGGSAAFPIGSETAYAVEFVDGGAAIVVSTGFRLVRFPLAPAMISAATLHDLRDSVARLVPAYQRPTRASLDERLLFSSPNP